MFTPQVYLNEPQTVGRCLHISFYKSGVGKPLEDGTFDIKETDRGADRAPADQMAAAHDEGYFYHDLIDIKLQSRFCSHHRSPLVYAQAAFDRYGDDWRNYPDLPPLLKGWFEAGQPMIEKEYPKLGRLHNFGYTGKDVPEEVATGYNPCSMCEHFKIQIDEATGAPIPFKGFCNKARAKSDNSLFSITESDKRDETYTFLSCHDYTPAKRWMKEEPREIPDRLLLFVETNPLNLTIGEIDSLMHFPLVARENMLEAVGLDELQEVDLVDLLKERHAEVDFNQFYSDFQLAPVADYFARGLRKENKHHKAFWAGFMPYKTADDALFNDPTFQRVAVDAPRENADLTTMLADTPAPLNPAPATPSDSETHETTENPDLAPTTES